MSENTPGQLVAAKTICLVMKVGSFGNTKKASLASAVFSADPKQEPDKTLLRLTKTLLDSPELTAIAKHDRAVATEIRSIAFKSLLKGGVYLVPISMVMHIDEVLRQAQERRLKLVDAAVEMYPTRMNEAAERLGVLADALDYPSAERFRSAFYFEYSYVTFDTPSRLKAISAEIFKQETEKARAKLESVAEECQQTMRAGLLKLTEHLRDRLTPNEDGKPKRLTNSAIENLNEFLKTFELRDVTDDVQLATIVQKARDVMSGLDHKTLKDDESIRKQVLAQLDEVTTALDPLVVDKETRAIDLEDE